MTLIRNFRCSRLEFWEEIFFSKKWACCYEHKKTKKQNKKDKRLKVKLRYFLSFKKLIRRSETCSNRSKSGKLSQIRETKKSKQICYVSLI